MNTQGKILVLCGSYLALVVDGLSVAALIHGLFLHTFNEHKLASTDVCSVAPPSAELSVGNL